MKIKPCFEYLGCAPGLNKSGECPGENCSEDRFCFEVAEELCLKVQNAIRGGGSLLTCSQCDYFKGEVVPKLPEGEAIQRLVDSKIQTEDEDQYMKDRAAMEVTLEPRGSFLAKYYEATDPADKLLLLEERESKLRLKIGAEALAFAECLHWVRTEQGQVRKDIEGLVYPHKKG